jgi:hypothetical protein
VVGEFVGSRSGLGYYMLLATGNFERRFRDCASCIRIDMDGQKGVWHVHYLKVVSRKPHQSRSRQRVNRNILLRD